MQFSQILAEEPEDFPNFIVQSNLSTNTMRGDGSLTSNLSTSWYVATVVMVTQEHSRKFKYGSEAEDNVDLEINLYLLRISWYSRVI